MINDMLPTRKEEEMKVAKVATAFMLMLFCLFLVLLWANIRAWKKIPERRVWEIMDYDKATHTIYLKRRINENIARTREVTKKRIDRLL